MVAGIGKRRALHFAETRVKEWSCRRRCFGWGKKCKKRQKTIAEICKRTGELWMWPQFLQPVSSTVAVSFPASVCELPFPKLSYVFDLCIPPSTPLCIWYNWYWNSFWSYTRTVRLGTAKSYKLSLEIWSETPANFQILNGFHCGTLRQNPSNRTKQLK